MVRATLPYTHCRDLSRVEISKGNTKPNRIKLTHLNARQQARQFHLETTLSTLDDTLHGNREGTLACITATQTKLCN